MDKIVFLELYQKVNSYISSQAYASISDDFMRKQISNTMQHAGKRVRPVLFCLSHEFFSPITEDALKIGHAIELFHNFTLVHDDIMDKAPLRRNQPTLFQLHGTDKALLIGDVMLIEVYDILQHIKNQHKEKIIHQFNQTAKDICIGQFWDLEQSSPDWSFDHYLDMIRLKTAVLLGRSLQLGALVGGGNEKTADILYQIGIKLGLIFQIKDDLLDIADNVYGVGKQKGGDILEGKKTILYFKAIELLPQEKQKQLNQLMHIDYQGKDKVEKVLELYQYASVEKSIEKILQEYMRTTTMDIQQLDISEHAKNDLLSTAQFLLHRLN